MYLCMSSAPQLTATPPVNTVQGIKMTLLQNTGTLTKEN